MHAGVPNVDVFGDIQLEFMRLQNGMAKLGATMDRRAAEMAQLGAKLADLQSQNEQRVVATPPPAPPTPPDQV